MLTASIFLLIVTLGIFLVMEVNDYMRFREWQNFSRNELLTILGYSVFACIPVIGWITTGFLLWEAIVYMRSED